MSKQWLSSLLMMCLVLTAHAKDEDIDHNYASHNKAKQLIDKMVKKHNFDRRYMENLMANANRKQSILDAIARPAEKTKPWKDYRRIFLTKTRTEQGKEFLSQYSEALTRAEREFGVPKEIITAIIGVETSYGRNKGRHRVLDALTTLGFDYAPRSSFFSRELEQFLLLTKEQKMDAKLVKGSYAGAMGYGQFIPSSYRSYAIDFDGDGVANIVDNPVDAIGSVANYFNAHGWRTGEMVVVPATVSKNYNNKLANKKTKPKQTLMQIQSQGYSASLNIEETTKVIPIRLRGDNGNEHWLGLKNFYVITRYNHSHLYAMAVYQLSETFK